MSFKLQNTRKEAKARGDKRYFTGKPCKRGHVCERYTSRAKCVECESEDSRKKYEKNSERYKKQSRQWQKDNKDIANHHKIKWAEKNPDKARESKQKWELKNKDKRKDYAKEYRYKNRAKINKKHAEYYSKNKDRIREYRKKTRHKYREKERQYSRSYYLENMVDMRQANSRWHKENPGKAREKTRRRSAAKMNATPLWRNQDVIDQIYELAAFASEESGMQYHVDHIVPLKGEMVCGLHVEYNLRVIPATDNLSKGNRLIEELL